MLPRLAILLLAATALVSADPHEERTWTGVNGKSFRGAYLTTDKKTGKYVFALAGGKSYTIDPANLSEQDRQWLDHELHPVEEAKPKASHPGAFLPDPKLDRTVFPTINQSDYGSKASDCVPSSFCDFVLWWDMEGYLPIDERGGFDKKAEYIHSRMARHFKTRNTAGTDLRDAEEGAKAYFEKELPELATVRVLSDYNCDPDNLRRYTVGANATLLGVSVYYGRKDEGGHVVALSDVDEKGDLIMYTWGARIRGRLKVLEKDLPLPVATTSRTGHKYEVEFMNKADLPDWMIDYDVRFEIDPGNWDGLMVISPYRYKTPGAGLPPPPDPVMEPAPPKGPERADFRRVTHPHLAPPPLPHEFRQGALYSRDWKNSAGSSLTGRVKSCDGASLVLDVDGNRQEIQLSDLSANDQARAQGQAPGATGGDGPRPVGGTSRQHPAQQTRQPPRLALPCHHLGEARGWIRRQTPDRDLRATGHVVLGRPCTQAHSRPRDPPEPGIHQGGIGIQRHGDHAWEACLFRTRRADEVLGFCRLAHLLPIRLQWTNTLNRTSEYAEYHVEKAGTFRLELEKIALGPQPGHLFEIPAAAATIEEGYFRQIPPTKQ